MYCYTVTGAAIVKYFSIVSYIFTTLRNAPHKRC